MRVFLVEDEPNIRTIFVDYCRDNNIALTHAASRDEALAVVSSTAADYDLAICDLRIPSSAGAVDEEVEHGLAVLRSLIDAWAGVPILVLSAFGTLDVVGALLRDARQIDVYGDTELRPMLQFMQKVDVVGAVAAIEVISKELQAISQIELVAPDLSPTYRRAVRIFARRRRGVLVDFKLLAGGRSGAQTGLATVRDHSGAQVAHAVAKLTELQRAAGETERYRRYVAGRLGAATYADLSDEVVAGCGSSAGLFYSVADTFDRDVFSVLGDDPEQAAAIVQAVAAMCAPWLTGVAQASKSWAEVRRNLLSDPEYDRVRSEFEVGDIPDSRAIQCLWTSQHGDLHGANILVDDVLRPVLIDFGRTGNAPSVLDPITLELAAAFHPDSPFYSDPWPSIEDLDKWSEVDAYVADSPYPEFVRACRDWAHEVNVGQRDLYAVVAAFCLRNLQYDDIDKERVLRLQQVASQVVNET